MAGSGNRVSDSAPARRFARSHIRQRPELGVKHNEFYSPEYLRTRYEGKAVGGYRKMLALAAHVMPEAGSGVAAAECELVHIAGPDVHTIETFEDVVGPAGPMPPETAAALPFVMLRNSTLT